MTQHTKVICQTTGHTATVQPGEPLAGVVNAFLNTAVDSDPTRKHQVQLVEPHDSSGTASLLVDRMPNGRIRLTSQELHGQRDLGCHNSVREALATANVRTTAAPATAATNPTWERD